MKKLSKLLAFILTLCIMASILCVPALAEESVDRYASLKQGTGYVALGDSYTRGYGCSDHWQAQNYTMDKYGNFNCRNVDGSYPNLVAEALGLYAPDDIRDTDGKMWNLAKNAISTAYTLDLLGIEDGFRDSEFTYKDGSISSRYRTDLAYFGDPMSYNFEGTGTYGKEGEVMSVRKLINDASLITVNLGHADVLYKAQWLDFNHIDFSNTETLPSEIAKLVSDLYEFFEYWKGAYPLLLDYIKENNPDATVVCLGQINPVETMTVTDDILLPIGEALTIIMDLMNKYTREYAEARGFIYIDVSNVETPSTESELSVVELLSMDGYNAGLATHPSEAGYAQIARMIVSAVDEKLAKDAAAAQEHSYVPDVPKTYIQVDLGRFKDVDFVLLDGRKVTNYTVDDNVITVPNLSVFAKSLLVVVAKEDGSVTVVVYSLKYDDGFNARRVYLTNNAFKTATVTLKKLTSLLSSIVGLLK